MTHIIEPPENPGRFSDKEEYPMKPTVYEVLKDFNPKGLGLFAIQDPETKDMFKTFEINTQSDIDGDVLEVARFCVSKFSQQASIKMANQSEAKGLNRPGFSEGSIM